jgi:hypothetical protein
VKASHLPSKIACSKAGMRKMDTLEIMLAGKMSQPDVHIDVLGADAKVFEIAYHDLRNYLKNHWNLVGQEAADSKLDDKIEKLLDEELVEFDMFLSVWVGMWQRKWTQRVKLVLGEQNQEKNKSVVNSAKTDSEALWNQLKSKKEIIELIVSSLVKNGELSGTEILAENILKTELAKNAYQEVNSQEQTLKLLNVALRRAREMTQNVSHLIFVKVEKGYYKSAFA